MDDVCVVDDDADEQRHCHQQTDTDSVILASGTSRPQETQGHARYDVCQLVNITYHVTSVNIIMSVSVPNFCFCFHFTFAIGTLFYLAFYIFAFVIFYMLLHIMLLLCLLHNNNQLEWHCIA